MDIPKPWSYNGKWMVWPKTVFDMINIVDCDDTINGVCLSGKTIEQCIEECTDGCAAGYHVQFESGNTICVPIRTYIHPYLNPVHRLRNQSIYSELDRVKVSTFVNTDIFPFPPDSANAVFFRDILTIKNTITGSTIVTKDEGQQLIYMAPNSDGNVQLLQAQISAGQVSQYIPVRYGESIQISIPSTSLIAHISNQIPSILEWSSVSGVFHGNDLSFRIMPIGVMKKIGDVVTYDDEFAIVYANDSVVVLDPKK